MDLAPSTALIFGNPKLGTPTLLASLTMGLDLPLRVLVYQGSGKVWIVYHAPIDVAALHEIPANHPAIKKMGGALAKLTSKAAGKYTTSGRL